MRSEDQNATAGLDLRKVVRAKSRGGKVIAQCPACAAAGADKSGEHLIIFDGGNGKWGCVAFQGDKEHRRQIAKLVGADVVVRPLRPILPVRPIARRMIQFPTPRNPTLRQLFELAGRRSLPFIAGLESATRAGMLHCATMRDAGEDVVVWLLMDSSKRCAQARRMDGKPWQGLEGNPKAKTLFGSEAAWPIGAADIGSRPYVALCEGGPDTLTAWSLAWWHGKSAEIAPCCMCGASPSIHPDALPYLKGKGVWTFPHRDPAGERAQIQWAGELLAAGALWVKPFDVSPHKDLNEWLTAAAGNIGGDE